MLKMFTKRMRDDKGFTLIELMVVVLIIAILLAIAIPTFLRVRRNAQERAAQSTVTDALKSVKAFYNGGAQEYTDDGNDLEASEATINYLVGTNPTCADLDADGPKCAALTLGTTVVANDTVTITALSQSGAYFSVHDVAGDDPATPASEAGTWYGQGDTQALAEADAVGKTNDSWT